VPQVYLQVKKDNPYSFVALVAAEGFRQLGYEIIPFEADKLDAVPWRRDIPVIGGVGTVKHALTALGIEWSHDTYPEELKPYLKRKVEIRQLGSLQNEELPLFIKPKEDDKKFTGFVCKDKFDWHLGGLSSDLVIYASEPIDIFTEYRCYILDNKILNISRYAGRVDNFPNCDTIRGMIMSYTTAPIAYSLDVGVTREGDTILVEVNEPLSLGNYGLAPVHAAKMIAARWFQLTCRDYSVEAACFDSPGFISNF